MPSAPTPRTGPSRFTSFLLGLLFLAGCSATKPPKGAVIIPRECLNSIELTPNTFCVVGPDGKLRCSNVKVNHKTGCVKLDVKK